MFGVGEDVCFKPDENLLISHEFSNQIHEFVALTFAAYESYDKIKIKCKERKLSLHSHELKTVNLKKKTF